MILRSVLYEVDMLLKNIDSEKLVITVDHDTAFIIYGVFCQCSAIFYPKVCRVLLAETTANYVKSEILQ